MKPLLICIALALTGVISITLAAYLLLGLPAALGSLGLFCLKGSQLLSRGLING
ncbi:hypothetical protein GCM10027347_58900 [Larkinella harenae]